MIYDYDKLLAISTGWLVIMIVSWAIENDLVYFWGNSDWVYDCDYDKLLVISTGWLYDCVSFLGYWEYLSLSVIYFALAYDYDSILGY